MSRSTGQAGPLRCPHCYAKTISPSKKIFLGPMFRSSCANCGGKWRISRWSIVTALSSLIAIPILFLLGLVNHVLSPSEGSFVSVAAATLAVAAMLIVHVVPVRKA